MQDKYPYSKWKYIHTRTHTHTMLIVHNDTIYVLYVDAFHSFNTILCTMQRWTFLSYDDVQVQDVWRKRATEE